MAATGVVTVRGPFSHMAVELLHDPSRVLNWHSMPQDIGSDSVDDKCRMVTTVHPSPTGRTEALIARIGEQFRLAKGYGRGHSSGHSSSCP